MIGVADRAGVWHRFKVCLEQDQAQNNIANQHPPFMTAGLISGGCLCGAVRYEASGRPFDVTHCHCADCRRSSGAPFVTWASFIRNNFRLTQGQVRDISWAGRLRSFCPGCGTPLTFISAPDTDELDVTVCSFDDPQAIVPADHTWVEDRLPWIRLADDLPAYAQKRPIRQSEEKGKAL
jgi:hypothetical protein